MASNGTKKTILYRVIHFLRDYKSEIKKIVWPNYKEVIKNTGIVLIMCAVVGVLIWAVDFGLGKLIELILNSVK
ncbi:MAG: preprotein translocase subunit SecE [Clostridia bacterium]|nr:preprotein translocase subunit SecE [Clostridia bacterium]